MLMRPKDPVFSVAPSQAVPKLLLMLKLVAENESVLGHKQSPTVLTGANAVLAAIQANPIWG